MSEGIIIYGVAVSLFGLILSAALSAANKLKASSLVMELSGLFGLVSGVFFLTNYPGQEVVIARFGFFWSLRLSLDFLSAIFFVILSGISCLVSFYGQEYLSRYRRTYNASMVQFFVSLFVFGMSGVLLASNSAGFMIFWELMSFSSFFLVMADKTQESARAAFLYFIMTHLGAAAILGGLLLLGGGDFGFSLSSVSSAVASASPSVVALSFGLFFFGFGSKAGLVPFHVWLPEAHPQAPTNVSALMSGLMLKMAFYGFLRIVLPFPHFPTWAPYLVILCGIISALFGALYAVVVRDIKKTFAYSSIENMGIIFTMIGIAMYTSSVGDFMGGNGIYVLLISFSIFHAINHAIFKTGLFLSSGVVINKTHSRRLEKMGGIAKTMPVFSVVFLLVILGSAALPPFGTFFGEWGFVRSLIALLQTSGPNVMAVFLFLSVLSLFALTSGLAAFAMVKVFSISMLGLPRGGRHGDDKLADDPVLVWPIMVMAALIVLSGIFAKGILNFIASNILVEKQSILASISISSIGIFTAFLLFSVLSYLAYKFLSRNSGAARKYHTWDCGQPIDASMEYTATAFSGPIRFFFLGLVNRRKESRVEPIIATNPWIAKRSLLIIIAPIWHEKFYKPVANGILWLAEKIRFTHTGRVQYYLLLLFMTIIITLIIAL